MANSLVDFIEELDSNAKLLEEYKEAPVTTAKTYGLSSDEVTIIKEQNWNELSRLFEDLGKAAKNIDY